MTQKMCRLQFASRTNMKKACATGRPEAIYGTTRAANYTNNINKPGFTLPRFRNETQISCEHHHPFSGCGRISRRRAALYGRILQSLYRPPNRQP